jgi:hypothetical protein
VWPITADTTVLVKTYYTDFRVKPNIIHPVANFTIAVPSASQIRYPFTPAPNLVANAKSAKQWGWTPLFWVFWHDYVPTGTIGDWGKMDEFHPDFYPDLEYDTEGPVYGPLIDTLARRRGANFNFGAMGDASTVFTPQDLLRIALTLNPSHLPLEQTAIAAGYYWWNNGHQKLANGAIISLDLAYLDKYNTDTAPVP